MDFRSAILTWLVLLLLLGLSLLSVQFLSGPLQYAISYTCAVAIGGCIMIFYMGLRTADGMIRVFAVGAIAWLALLLLLTILEVLTR